MIYHVTTRTNWENALTEGFYSAESLALEGFIHMSKEHQVAGVLHRYYNGVNDLVLLHVDETKLSSIIKLEPSPSLNEEFPHVFGVINLDAVIKVEEITSL